MGPAGWVSPGGLHRFWGPLRASWGHGRPGGPDGPEKPRGPRDSRPCLAPPLRVQFSPLPRLRSRPTGTTSTTQTMSNTAKPVTVLDPAGRVRATLASPASFEALVAAAWGLGGGESLQVLAVAGGKWELFTWRPGHVPVCAPTGVQAGPEVQGTGRMLLAALCEVAWAGLLDEGWTARS
jgi:hypothetical protein